jgi:hypothetical protein
LMRFAAFDVTSGGPSAQMLAAIATSPVSLALPLRFMALFHRLALEGTLPELARHFPSCGGLASAEAAWLAIRGAMESGGEPLRSRLPAAVQTNEVGRSCALLARARPSLLRVTPARNP